MPGELSDTKLGEYVGSFDIIAQYGAVLMKNDERSKLNDI